MRPRLLPLLAAALFALGAGVAAADMRLLMFEEKWCEYCERWNEEVGVVYGKTEEGRRAPLQRVNIHGDWPGDVELKMRAQYTPTFVLVRDGRELGRIEGYPGEDFFWGLLNQMLERAERGSADG